MVNKISKRGWFNFYIFIILIVSILLVSCKSDSALAGQALSSGEVLEISMTCSGNNCDLYASNLPDDGTGLSAFKFTIDSGYTQVDWIDAENQNLIDDQTSGNNEFAFYIDSAQAPIISDRVFATIQITEDLIITPISAKLSDDTDVVANQISMGGSGVYTNLVVPTSSEITVNQRSGSNANPAVTISDDGSFIVAWRGSTDTSDSIFAQRFDSTGDKLCSDLSTVLSSCPGDYSDDNDGEEPEFIVNDDISTDKDRPSLDVSTDGSLVTVWEGDDASSLGVFGQLFNPVGSKVGNEFPVNTVTDSVQEDPSVVFDNAGGFIVVWQSKHVNNALLSYEIFAQWYDNIGNKVCPDGNSDLSTCEKLNPGYIDGLESEFRINTVIEGSQLNPSIAISDSGNFVVVWEGPDSDLTGIFAQRFDSAGTPLGSEFQVNSESLDRQSDPDVAMASDGSFVVVWENEFTDNKLNDIVAQWFNSDGTLAGGEFHVNSMVLNEQINPAIAMSDDGDAVVVWESLGQDPTDLKDDYGIYAQVFDSDGPIGSEFRVNTDIENNQYDPNVAITSDGSKFVVVWEDELSNDISAQVYSTTGQGLNNPPVIVSTQTNYVVDENIEQDPAPFVDIVIEASDADGDTLTFTVDALDGLGSFSQNVDNGVYTQTYRYYPLVGFLNNVQFTVTVSDGTGTTKQDITITILETITPCTGKSEDDTCESVPGNLGEKCNAELICKCPDVAGVPQHLNFGTCTAEGTIANGVACEMNVVCVSGNCDSSLCSDNPISATDTDGDTIVDGIDNCPGIYNTDQADNDNPDFFGDLCDGDDGDADNDGIVNSEDNCPGIPNPEQENNDNPLELFGDACDGTGGDADGDGINNGIDDDLDGDGFNNVDNNDNCPLVYSSDQTDTDGDGVGDICDDVDDTPVDTDGDGISDVDETTAGTDPNLADSDADGICDGSIAVGTCTAGPDLCVGDDSLGDADDDGICDDIVVGTEQCGNGICACTQGESSITCQQDCGVATTLPTTPVATCGNNVCEAGEDVTNCLADCTPTTNQNVCDLATEPTQCATYPLGSVENVALLPPYVRDAINTKSPNLIAPGCSQMVILSSGDPRDSDTDLFEGMNNPGCGNNPDGEITLDCVDLEGFIPSVDSVVFAVSSEWDEFVGTQFTDWMRISSDTAVSVDDSINNWDADLVDVIEYGPDQTGVVVLASIAAGNPVNLRVADSGDSGYDTALFVVPAVCVPNIEGEILLCGNNVVDPGEACDDGKQCFNGDPCTADTDCSTSVCQVRDGDGCSSSCLVEEFCGNGVCSCETGEHLTCEQDCGVGATVCERLEDLYDSYDNCEFNVCPATDEESNCILNQPEILSTSCDYTEDIMCNDCEVSEQYDAYCKIQACTGTVYQACLDFGKDTCADSCAAEKLATFTADLNDINSDDELKTIREKVRFIAKIGRMLKGLYS